VKTAASVSEHPEAASLRPGPTTPGQAPGRVPSSAGTPSATRGAKFGNLKALHRARTSDRFLAREIAIGGSPLRARGARGESTSHDPSAGGAWWRCDAAPPRKSVTKREQEGPRHPRGSTQGQEDGRRAPLCSVRPFYATPSLFAEAIVPVVRGAMAGAGPITRGPLDHDDLRRLLNRGSLDAVIRPGGTVASPAAGTRPPRSVVAYRAGRVVDADGTPSRERGSIRV